MTSNQLPAVLTFKPPQSSISVYRALKNARDVIEALHVDPAAEDLADRIQAAFDDLELMMQAVT